MPTRAISCASGLTLCVTLMACGEAAEVVANHCPDPGPWRTLIASHLTRYPGMEMVDAFKLLQQATTGSEHVVRDSTVASSWMQREWHSMGQGPAEPMIDTLGSNGTFARVHLRPFRDGGGDPMQLTAAFIATSRVAADTALLGCALSAATSAIPWDSAAWHGASAQWRADGYPAMHHSDRFAAAYRPAYRVVQVERASTLLRNVR